MTIKNQMTMNRLRRSASLALVAMLAGTATAQTPADSAAAGGLKPPPYWIGVQCAQRDDAESSIEIVTVLPNEPAAKAGLRVGDRIIAINDDKLDTIKDLVRLIQDSEGEQVRLTVQREDHQFEAKMTPTRRYAAAYTWPGLRTPNLVDWFQQQAESGHNPGIDMTLINPGVVLESSVPRFPANTRFTLERRDDGPITLTVKRGDEQWSATADDLQAIPDDLRPWAKRLLTTASSRAPLFPQLPPDIHLLLPAPMQSFDSRRSPRDLEQPSEDSTVNRPDLLKHLDDLSRQMDALRKAIEEQ